jgi:AraC-like DNA-binding protein
MLTCAEGSHTEDLLFSRGGYLIARHCCLHPAVRGMEKTKPHAEIALVRTGAFVWHGRAGRVLAQPGTAVLFNQDDPLRIDHPHGGDECLVLSLPAVELARATGDEPDAHRSLPTLVRGRARVPTALQRRGYALERLACRGLASPLALQEEILALVHALASDEGATPPRARRPATVRQHEDLVMALRDLLWRRLGEDLDLPALATELHTSPFHLARVFRAHTGSTVHAQLLELRLHAALERLRDGERDLSRLAHDLGFADHSHFTRTFRRATGVTPSAFRSNVVLRTPAPASGALRR